MHHLLIKNLVAVVEVIVNPDAGLALEIYDGVRRDVVAPVEDAENLLLIS